MSSRALSTSETLTVVIEASDACETSSCRARHWDVNLVRPTFLVMSEVSWLQFKMEMSRLVGSYQREGLVLLMGIICLILIHFVHDSITVQMSVVFLMVGALIAITLMLKRHNEEIDKRIMLLCRQYSDSSATFVYEIRGTRFCKPRHEHTYRALHIRPLTFAPLRCSSVIGVPVADTTSLVDVETGIPTLLGRPVASAILPQGAGPHPQLEGQLVQVRASPAIAVATSSPDNASVQQQSNDHEPMVAPAIGIPVPSGQPAQNPSEVASV